MSLVNKIQELCKNKSTNQSTLERELGFGKGTISKWDKSSPSGDKLQKVADYFHVSIDFLLGREENALPSKVRTIAAHLEDKDITDQKMDLIMQYLNALFDKTEKELKNK